MNIITTANYPRIIIHLFILMMEMGCVHCEAGTVIQINIAFKIYRRFQTAKVRVQSWSSPSEICGGKCGAGTEFSPSTSVFPWPYHSSPFAYSSLPRWHFDNAEKGLKSENLQRSKFFFGIRGVRNRKVF